MIDDTREFSTEQNHRDEEEHRRSRASQFAEDVAGALLSPGRTLRSIGEREAIIPAMLLVFLIVVLASAGQVAVLFLSFFELIGIGSNLVGAAAGVTAALQMLAILSNLFWAPIAWTILAAMLYGVAYLLGGRGRFMAFWAASGFALAPQLLVAPLASANEVLGWLGVGWQLLGWLFVLPVTIGAFVWTIALFVIALRETMEISTGRAVGTIATLAGILMLIAVVIACVIFLLIFAIVAALAA